MSQYNVDEVAKAINVPVEDWPGNCYAIANQMLEAGFVPRGRLRYGHWLGPIHPNSYFAGRPLSNHGWIEHPTNNTIIDPTRWVFEFEDPYIYVGPSDYYDRGGNILRKALRQPCPPFNPMSQEVKLNLDPITAEFVRSLLGDDLTTENVTCVDQVFWLANTPLQDLGSYAQHLYLALENAGFKAAIPIDNYRMVMDG